MDDSLCVVEATSSWRPIVVAFHVKGIKQLLIVFNVIETIVVLIDKVVAGVGFITKIYLVLSDDGGVVLVVIDSPSF